MKSQKPKPILSRARGAELPLSNSALTELLRAVLDKGMPFRFQARGFSMHPLIKDSDIITVSPISGAAPRLGDVVVFIHPKFDNLILHRVVGKKGNRFLIKGDNIQDYDGYIPRDRILGYVTKVERDDKLLSIGLGPERVLISFLTRRRRFYPSLLPIWRLIRPLIGRSRYD